jgi:shikimate dehydrogenase
LLDAIDDDARRIGAVNAVLVHEGTWKGFNTDHIGFGKALDEVRKPNDTKALILGDGGAAKAVKYALDQREIPYLVVSRSGTLNYNELPPNHLRAHSIIVNTTPLGMTPDESAMPDIPYEAVTSQHLLFDLIYHPRETRFLARGKALGARTLNGERMLHIQADESWKIWQSHV